jgi:hypothetical protein
MAPQALIVHKDRTAAEASKEVLASRGYHCTIAAGFDEALVHMDWLRPALLVLERSPTAAQLPSLEGRKSAVSVATFDTLDATVDLRKTDGIKIEADQAVGHVKTSLTIADCRRRKNVAASDPTGNGGSKHGAELRFGVGPEGRAF